MGSRRTLPISPAGGGGHLRSHCGADINSRAPVESLVDERNGAGAAAAENDGADGHAGGIFPGRIDGRTLRSRSGEARVGMRRLGAGLLCAISGVHSLPLPVQALGGRLVGHAFPPHAAFRSESHIGEDGVAGESCHRVGIGFLRRSRGHAKESGFRIDGAQTALGVGLDPGNVVSHRPNLPVLQSRRAAPSWRNWSCRRNWERPPRRMSFCPWDLPRPG